MFTELQHCWSLIEVNHVCSRGQGRGCAPAIAPWHSKDDWILQCSQKSGVGNCICLVTAVLGDYSVVLFMLSAWQRRPSFEHPVQLEGLSQANWKHLYWCQPRVWICPLHRHFPAGWRKSHTWNSEDRGIWATGGCLPSWAPHWNSISSTPRHQ